MSPTSESFPLPLDVSGLSVIPRRGAADGAQLHEIGLTVQPGEAVAVVGESGAGKTLLLCALLGLLTTNAALRVRGAMRLFGTTPDTAERRRILRQRVGVLLQDAQSPLDPSQRIGRQLAARMAAGGDPVSLLVQVGVVGAGAGAPLAAYPHQLSPDLRQRASLAVALASAPDLLLLDEPTAELDLSGKAALLRTLADVRDRGTAMLLLTDDLAAAALVATRVVVLHAGQIVETGSMEDVLAHPVHPYTAAMLTARWRLGSDRTRGLPNTARDRQSSGGGLGTGCAYRGRCPAGTTRCAQEPALRPAMQHAGQVACWNANAPRRPTPLPPTLPPVPASHPTPLLTLEGVGRRYASPGRMFARRSAATTVALDGIDLRLGDREAMAIVGESGAGKSTLLRIAAGLVRPSAGKRGYTGKSPPQLIFRRPLAAMPPWLTVAEIVGERLGGNGLSKAGRATRIEEALAMVQLDPGFAQARPRELSQAQAQRVAIARAVIVQTPLLLCDEPLAELDPLAAASILTLLVTLRRELRMAMLFATDDLAAARYLSDRIVVLYGGRIVEAGPAARLLGAPQSPYTRELLSAVADRP